MPGSFVGMQGGFAGFKRDSRGIGEFLRSSSVAAAIRGKAHNVARQVGGSVTMEITDRARATVSIEGGNKFAKTLRDGDLIRAAYNAGLEFRTYE